MRGRVEISKIGKSGNAININHLIDAQRNFCADQINACQDLFYALQNHWHILELLCRLDQCPSRSFFAPTRIIDTRQICCADQINAYYDGVRAEPRSRQICLAPKDNNQADASRQMRDERWGMRIEVCRWAAGGLVVTPSVSWGLDPRLLFGGFIYYQLRCIRELFSLYLEHHPQAMTYLFAQQSCPPIDWFALLLFCSCLSAWFGDWP